MNTTVSIVIGEGENHSVMWTTTGDHVKCTIRNYDALKKWETLIAVLDNKFGEKKIIGEDTKNYSFKTFEYLGGIWIHLEPTEFLIDIDEKLGDVTVQKYRTEITKLIKSVGYEIRYWDDQLGRLSVNVPF